MAEQTGGAGKKHEVSAASLSGYVKYLRLHNKLEAVKGKVTRSTAALLDNPPLNTAWLDRAPLDDVLEAVAALEGLPGVQEMSYRTTHDAYGPFVRNTMRGVLGLFGATPATLFKRLNRLVGMFERGSTFSYTDAGPTSGVIEVRTVQPTGRPGFTVWQGVFKYLLDVAGQGAGQVEPPEVFEKGYAARYKVRW